MESNFIGAKKKSFKIPVEFPLKMSFAQVIKEYFFPFENRFNFQVKSNFFLRQI